MHLVSNDRYIQFLLLCEQIDFKLMFEVTHDLFSTAQNIMVGHLLKKKIVLTIISECA